MHILVAGERRYTACESLGWMMIPVRYFEDLDPATAQIVELEENLRRSDLEWQEVVMAVRKIWDIKRSLRSNYTQAELGQDLGYESQGHVSFLLLVSNHLSDPTIYQCSTLNEAKSIIRRRTERAAQVEMDAITSAVAQSVNEQEEGGEKEEEEDLPASPPTLTYGTAILSTRPIVLKQALKDPNKAVLSENFLAWAPGYTGPKFNFIHCDFPYGVEVFAGTRTGRTRHIGGGYEDEEDKYELLLRCLLTNLPKLMASSAHLLFWYSHKKHDLTMRLFHELAPHLEQYAFPLVWMKSDNSRISPDMNRWPCHCYETALLFSSGRRLVSKIVSDCYSGPTDKTFHVSAKPEPMLRHFFSMLVDGTTDLLDPTCGGGSALRAAESCGARSTLGMDSNEECVTAARIALRQSRNKQALGA
jgi:hypothetical protein